MNRKEFVRSKFPVRFYNEYEAESLRGMHTWRTVRRVNAIAEHYKHEFFRCILSGSYGVSSRSEWVGPHSREMARTMIAGIKRIFLRDESAHLARVMSGTDPTDAETVVDYLMTRPFNAVAIDECA